MKVLVFSDTHGRRNEMAEIVERFSELRSVNYIIHLGDLVQDARFVSMLYPELPMTVVRGNNDWDGGTVYECVVSLCGQKIYVLHGHTRGVDASPGRAAAEARRLGCGLLLYGHTHVASEFWEDGLYCLNPGSLRSPRDGRRPSFGVAEITEKVISTRVMYV